MLLGIQSAEAMFEFINLNYLQEQMEPKSQEPEEEGLIKSTFEETLQAIEQRKKFFLDNHLSYETQLLRIPSQTTVKSISDIVVSLGGYLFNESPVQPNLRDLYTSQYQPMQFRCVLPPPSQGEESVNGDSAYQPSFNWISKVVIDSTMLDVDQIQAKRIEKGKLPTQWTNVTELLIFNLSKKIHLKQEVKSIEIYLQNSFGKFPWVKVKKVKELFYKGKPSALIKFADDYGCSFAYYNLIRLQHNRKQSLGHNSEVFRVVSNRIKNIQQQKWVAVLFRKLPSYFTKETLLEILRKKNLSPIWMEELIQIENYRYTLCKVSFLDDAFEFCSSFQMSSSLKDIKVNLHPKSCKAWKRDHKEFPI